MTKYNIAELARGRTRRRKVKLRPIKAPHRLKLEYRSLLRGYLDDLKAEVMNGVVPLVEAHIELTQDKEHWFTRLKVLEQSLRQRMASIVDRIFAAQSANHRRKFMEGARDLLGVDLESVVRENDMADLLELYSAQNASLITSLGADTIKKVEQVIYRHQLGEVGYDNLSKMLQEQFQLSKVSADLIATDQVQKLGADLNKIRQEQAGVTTYVWRTARDERVRDRHINLNGKSYRWGEPTGAEEGLPPGKPIRCRCVAIAEIEVPQ